MKARGLGVVYRRPDTTVWWIAYVHGGKRIRESSHSTDRREAERLLKTRLGEAAAGRLTPPDTQRVTLRDLVAP